jgi:hypothetical protein
MGIGRPLSAAVYHRVAASETCSCSVGECCPPQPRETPLQQVVALGGDIIPGFASFDLTDDVPPSEYELAAEVVDLLAKESDRS